jgi:hypothetical protein
VKYAETTAVGTEVGCAQDGPFACSQCSLQVFPTLDFNQSPQGSRAITQPFHINRLAGNETESLSDYLLDCFGIEFITENCFEVPFHLGPDFSLEAETEVSAPARDTIPQRGRKNS